MSFVPLWIWFGSVGFEFSVLLGAAIIVLVEEFAYVSSYV